MPLFGGNKRPKLDGLTKDEEKRRDALNPEVMSRAGEKGVAGQGPAAAAILREKMDKEPSEFIWPLLLGWQLLSMRRFDHAIEAFQEAVSRDKTDVRGHFGAGHAFFEAAEVKLRGGDALHAMSGVAENMTVDNLYHESLRSFRQAFDMTPDKEERDKLRNAMSVVEKALAKKAGRL
jgi:tetratricopeptide (TPR) repeat protein